MIWFRVGCIAMFLAVALGAFGAHALRTKLSADMLAIFETAVRYQVYHALGLFAVAFAWDKHPSALVTAAGWSLTIGILVFSGSLYVLSTTGVRWLGAVTPIGGTAFLAGWILLLVSTLR